MPGHVFVTRGDMKRLMCDAWCLPCDRALRIVPGWLEASEGFDAGPVAEAYLEAVRGYFVEQLYAGGKIRRFEARRDRLTEAWDDEDSARVVGFTEWSGGPRPWLVHVGSHPQRPIEWYMEGLRQFLERANQELADATPLCGRARPLVAVHAVGTGLGGAHYRKAEIIWQQLKTLYAFVERDDCAVDVVFVAWEKSAFAAAQACRRTSLRDPNVSTQGDRASSAERFWPTLNTAQRERAQGLARRAASGNLVLFLGAGVSIPAGLPSWGEMLLDAAKRCPELVDSCEALSNLDPLDQAQLIERFAPELREEVAGRLQPAHCTLGHLLLATLPVSEVVTQNYDRLFEQAAFAVGRPVAVIPGTRVADESRWLLKMHGSVDTPRDIVLTREDYLRYGEGRAALAGIVQALLITKHMLFVGFSLSDPNFHRIADDVRKVLRPETEADGETFGTVLLLLEDSLREQLWDQDLGLAPFGSEGKDFADVARLHDIFLDYLLYESTASAAYLLDPAYEHALTAPEKKLRDALSEILFLREELSGTPTWDAVERLLRELSGSG
jgi:hypothetical protein